jgi:hypothetical protein
MNNRIQELAMQASKQAFPVNSIAFMETFAQLIIQECTALTLDHRSSDYYNGWLDYRDEIKKHFGVEK